MRIDGCFASLWPEFTEDAQEKFETARFYKNHLRCVTQDRELEEWFQDGFFISIWWVDLFLSALNMRGPAACRSGGSVPNWGRFQPFDFSLGHWASDSVLAWAVTWAHWKLSNHLMIVSFLWSLEIMSEPAKDGMDQSKFALPRNRIIQSSKEASAFVRPRIKLHGLWVHGISLNLYVIHPGVPADSSLIIECFSLALQDAIDMLERAGKQVPKECLIWVFQLQWVTIFWWLSAYCFWEGAVNLLSSWPFSVHRSQFKADNTVRETKNGAVMKMMCTLLGKQHMACAGMFFARTGHTHGPLGGSVGVIF